MSEKYNQLKELINEIEPDVNKFFENGNKAAGTRVRGAMQELKKIAQEVRLEVQAMKNS